MADKITQTLEALRPVFDRHGVPEDDRRFLFDAFDRLIEEDYDNETVAGAVERGVVEADTYEDLLLMYDRGHRRNKAWFRSSAYEEAAPTKRGRALLRDLAAANPDWKDVPPSPPLKEDGEPWLTEISISALASPFPYWRISTGCHLSRRASQTPQA